MVTNSDLQKWQQSVDGIRVSLSKLSQEELSAIDELETLFKSNNFESDESKNYIQIIKNAIPQHRKDRILHVHLKNFLSLCEVYFKNQTTISTGISSRTRQTNINEQTKDSNSSLSFVGAPSRTRQIIASEKANDSSTSSTSNGELSISQKIITSEKTNDSISSSSSTVFPSRTRRVITSEKTNEPSSSSPSIDVPSSTQQIISGRKTKKSNTGFIVEFSVTIDDEQQKCDLQQIKQLYKSGKITSDTMVWKEGMEQCCRAGDCPELDVVFKTSKKSEKERTKASIIKRKILLPIILTGGFIAIGIALFFLFSKKGDVSSSRTNSIFNYSLIPVSSNGERWGYINQKGEYVINPQFEYADFFSDGLAKVGSGGKTGYINTNGEFVIPMTFKAGVAFRDGLAFVVSEGGHITCIDKSGNTKFVLKEARYATAFSEGLAMFVSEVESKSGFVDKNGNVVIQSQFDGALPFSGGRSRILIGDFGFIDEIGKIVINPQFREVGNFSEGFASFFDGRQWGYINKSGTYAINPQFDQAGRFSEGFAVIRQGRTYGYINSAGRIVINPQYDNASPFSDGLAAVAREGRYGYINKSGESVIIPQFEYAREFVNGIAPVFNANRWGIINKKGEYVVNPQFQTMKFIPSIEENPDFVESDYYDTSEFIKLFFERESGSMFDGIRGTTTLEALSEHPVYGSGVNAQDNNIVDYSQIIFITNDIYIGSISFVFNSKPIFSEVESVNNWGYRTTQRELDFTATPDAIMYRFNLSGRASEKRNVVLKALKNEIERRQGQTMKMENNVCQLLQEDGKLSFVIRDEGTSLTLIVAFNKEGI